MERQEIAKIVDNFLIEEFEIDETAIAEDALLINDLGIESLDFVDIVVIIEKEFNFKVKREDMAHVRTLGDLYTYIEQQVK